jgi:hypothetical protein
MTPSGTPGRDILFAFPWERGGERQARILARSLWRFGGAFARAPLVAVAPVDEMPERESIMALGVELLSYEPEPALRAMKLGSKAEAAQAAEEHARRRAIEVLAWMDLDSIILDEPAAFLLPANVRAAFRPVHHRLIGSPVSEPPDAFWTAVLGFCGADPSSAFAVTSTVDRERIRFYPNAGCLAVRPREGILTAWRDCLVQAVGDAGLLAMNQEPLQSLFLHQALLAGTILARVPETGLLELPFAYNYPVHLHRKVPEALRPGRLEDLVTARYEDFAFLEDGGLPMGEAVRRVLFGA